MSTNEPIGQICFCDQLNGEDCATCVASRRPKSTKSPPKRHPIMAIASIRLENRMRDDPQWTGEATICEDPLTKVTAWGESPEEVLAKLRSEIADVVFSGKLIPCAPGCILVDGHSRHCDIGD